LLHAGYEGSTYLRGYSKQPRSKDGAITADELKEPTTTLYQLKKNGRNPVSLDMPISRETHLCH
jgi:hypothetical protein